MEREEIKYLFAHNSIYKASFSAPPSLLFIYFIINAQEDTLLFKYFINVSGNPAVIALLAG